MEASALVIVLVSLVVPILMLLGAILFDVSIVLWAGLSMWNDRVTPRIRAHVHADRLRRFARRAAAVHAIR